MANLIGNNPWVLDTAADNIIPPDRWIYPKAVRWIGEAIADGDEFQLEDGQEIVKFRHFATADDTGVTFAFPADFAMLGCSLGVLTHGEVYLYF